MIVEFYEAVRERRCVREFFDREVDFEAIKRILSAGNLAPTWNHNRTWSYIILSEGCTYVVIPLLKGIGYADPEETVLEQNEADNEKQLHFGSWK